MMSRDLSQVTHVHNRCVLAPSVKWRPLAKQMLPTTFADASINGLERISTYTFFSSLLPEVREAHQIGESKFLANAYGFAEWSFNHRAEELWNAVAVSFYEHLLDDGVNPATILPWISKKIRTNVLGLWEWRLSRENFENLQEMIETVKYRHEYVCGRALTDALKQMGISS